VENKTNMIGTLIDPEIWDNNFASRFDSVPVMARYLAARLAGSRGSGPVQASTLRSSLSQLKSWLIRETGTGSFNRVFSTMSYPKVFKALDKVEADAEGDTSATLATQGYL
jgi:hypothetical protein